MDVIILQAFVGLMLVAGALLFFAFSLKQGDSAQADRLSLLPMERDENVARPVDQPPPESERAHESRR